MSAGSSANCWGEFDGGPRGLGSISFDTSYATMAPNIVDGGHAWTQVVTGYRHTCGLDEAGAAWCWGADNIGQLGRAAGAPDSVCGLAPSPCSKVPIAVDGGYTFTSLSAGGAHTCGVTTTGDVYCWGSDDAGQVGVGGAADLCAGAFHIRCALAPVKVYTGSLVVFTQVSAGESHTCALSDSLQAYCWGDDSYGQLGIGGGQSPAPSPVKTDLRFVALSGGSSHTCGIAVGGAAWCWGDNASGELGNGTTLDVNVPVPVAGP
ncbi:MAG: RCC1 domain-containing protein [Gemmatimonadales bacterium]